MLFMRVCSRCKKKLSEENFNWKIKGSKRSYHCKSCSREYIRTHYKNNTDYYLRKTKKRNEELRQKAYKHIGYYLKTHSCVDCGEDDILVLEFDHRNKENKVTEISRIVRKRVSFKKLVIEISKCDVRCANCHRRKTEKENNSWKLKYSMHP